jgi:tetratricopeptide (TPR) repeat protein
MHSHQLMARALVALLLLAATGQARADDAAVARKHYERGTTLYDLRRYREAAAEYERAFELRNEPSLLFDIGQAYRLAGDYEPALRSYRAYLRRLPNAPDRPEVLRHIALTEKLLDEQRGAGARHPAGEAAPTPPAPAPAPAPSLQPSPALTATAPAPAPTPVYKKWWLWTVVGVVAAGTATGIALAVTLPKDAPIPAGATVLQFH